jgi:hypothetical protein
MWLFFVPFVTASYAVTVFFVISFFFFFFSLSLGLLSPIVSSSFFSFEIEMDRFGEAILNNERINLITKIQARTGL